MEISLRPFLRRILRSLLPPPQVPKHKEDRLKALAGVLQTIALSTWGLGLVSPLIAGAGTITPRKVVVALMLGVAFELASLTLLAYVPYDDASKGG